MFARQWMCHRCGHTNFGSFSQGRCANCNPTGRLNIGLEPHTDVSPMQVQYEEKQAKLNLLHQERAALDRIIASTMDEINRLKRDEAKRLGHRPRSS